MQTSGTLVAEMTKGALAGAAGVWIMDRLDWLMVEHGDQEAWRKAVGMGPTAIYGATRKHLPGGVMSRGLV